MKGMTSEHWKKFLDLKIIANNGQIVTMLEELKKEMKKRGIKNE